MREKEMFDKMQQDIVIPDIVQIKADDAFRKIQKENSKVVKIRTHKRKGKMMWIAAAAAILAFGTTVCAAAYVHWSRGLAAEFQMTPEEKQLLEEQEYMSPIITEEGKTEEGGTGESGPAGTGGVTVQGVTVTPLQMIVDDRFAWLSFKVEGYDLEDGKEPCFHTASIVLDDDPEAVISHFSSFYDGLCYDGSGFYYEDGTPAEDADGNIIEKYVNDEGYMEYIIQINGSQYEEGLVGSSAHVAFQDLGTVYKAEFTGDLQAAWEFDLTLKGSDEVRKIPLSAPLGESGATVIYAEISPISLYVQYDFPLREEEMEGVNEKGEKIMSTTFAEAPELVGVRLKDGTYLPYITNGGSVGYLEGNEAVYEGAYATSRVIDTSQVDALLFLKKSPQTKYNGEAEWIEENLYIVPVE